MTLGTIQGIGVSMVQMSTTLFKTVIMIKIIIQHLTLME